MSGLKPTIFTKGLILISVPLVFELALGFTLLELQNQYEQRLAEQIKINSIIAHANELWLSTTDAVTSKMAAIVFRRSKLDTRCDLLVPHIETEYRLLRELVKDDSAQVVLVDTIKAHAAGMISISANFGTEDEFSGLATLRADAHTFKEMKRQVDRMGENIRSFRAPWEQKSKDSAGSIAQSKRVIQLVTMAGLISSVFIAGFLFLFFIRGIYSSIRLLVQNTNRLAAGQALLPALTNQDELGLLNRQFHQMADSLKESERIKQEFFDMVSHDMRTPLTSIHLALGLLLASQSNVPKEFAETLEKTERNAKHLINLIDNLLDIEKLEKDGITLDSESFDLLEVCSLASEIVKPLADRSKINILLPSVSTSVFADKQRISRVIINLLSNAVKFSPKGAAVEMRIEDKSACEIKLSVIDKGRGIPPHLQETIFQRFKQVKAEDASKSGGSGLGLAICKAFIEAHGGNIGVTSTVGEGSVFWFRLPKPEQAKDQDP